MTAVYERSPQRMKRFGESIMETRKEASEALTKQLDRATEQLTALKQRVANGLSSLKESTIATARETQDAFDETGQSHGRTDFDPASELEDCQHK